MIKKFYISTYDVNKIYAVLINASVQRSEYILCYGDLNGLWLITNKRSSYDDFKYSFAYRLPVEGDYRNLIFKVKYNDLYNIICYTKCPACIKCHQILYRPCADIYTVSREYRTVMTMPDDFGKIIKYAVNTMKDTGSYYIAPYGILAYCDTIKFIADIPDYSNNNGRKQFTPVRLPTYAVSSIARMSEQSHNITLEYVEGREYTTPVLRGEDWAVSCCFSRDNEISEMPVRQYTHTDSKDGIVSVHDNRLIITSSYGEFQK